MDITKIKRRERRFYRTEKDGEIEYNAGQKQKETSVIKENRIEKTEILSASKPSKEITSDEKKIIIDKILKDMKNTINPDIDEITDVIYSQLSKSNTDVNITLESVKQAVKNNAHYRSSRRNTSTENTTDVASRTGENFDFLMDRKELELVIDDVVEENKKEDIRTKDEKENLQKAMTEEKPKSKKHEEKPKEKPAEKKKEKKEKEELKLNFGDEEEVTEENEETDELGLKF